MAKDTMDRLNHIVRTSYSSSFSYDNDGLYTLTVYYETMKTISIKDETMQLCIDKLYYEILNRGG